MKNILAFALLGFFPHLAFAAPAPAPKVLMVINEGYRPEEYFEPRKLFDQAGFAVKVTARYPSDVHPSRKHISEVPPVAVDLVFEKAKASDYDAVVFVGGVGAWEDFLPNPEVHRILLESIQEGKLTALICAATGLLATAGNLDGSHPHFKDRHVTGYYEVEGLLKKVGLVRYDAGVANQPYVVTDGRLITGRDPISAKLFGGTVVTALKAQGHAQ